MPKTARIVSFASSKGGAGKTTAASSLGVEFAAQGSIVIMLDADPKSAPHSWSSTCQEPRANLRVIGGVTEHNLLDQIEWAGREADLVFVDLEGTANNALTYAISQSDLVVIPAQASAPDLLEAFRAIALLERAAKVVKHPIPHRVLLSKMPVLSTRVGKHARHELEEQGAVVFAVELMERVVFKEMTFTGRTPREEDPLSSAARNVAALAAELRAALGQWA